MDEPSSVHRLDRRLHRLSVLLEATGKGTQTSLQSAIERRNADAARETEIARGRQREALELQDGVVQGLVTARLAHDLGQESESREALAETLDRAKVVVTRSLEELKATGLTTRQLTREAASPPPGMSSLENVT